jgi:AcrR family transcriptional regulator
MHTMKTPSSAALAKVAIPAARDGRHLRSERTRAAIVSALLTLADQGELAPTAQQLADAAGVALRSIRQHFATREELFVAAAAEHARRTKELRVDVDSTAPLSTRITAFAKVRTKELETTAPLRRAAELAEESSQIVARAMAAARAQRRKEVARVFAKEVAAATDAEVLLDQLDLITSGRGYDMLRRDCGRSEATARSRMERFLSALLR